MFQPSFLKDLLTGFAAERQLQEALTMTSFPAADNAPFPLVWLEGTAYQNWSSYRKHSPLKGYNRILAVPVRSSMDEAGALLYTLTKEIGGWVIQHGLLGVRALSRHGG